MIVCMPGIFSVWFVWVWPCGMLTLIKFLTLKKKSNNVQTIYLVGCSLQIFHKLRVENHYLLKYDYVTKIQKALKPKHRIKRDSWGKVE